MENRNMNESLETEQNPEIPDKEKNHTAGEGNSAAEEARKDSGSGESCGESGKEEPNESAEVRQEEASSDDESAFRLKKELEKSRKELEELKDKYLRLCAEYDNYRKRTQKEKIEAYADAKIDAVKAFLPLLDNMEKAREFAKDDKNLEAILKQFDDILNTLGVKAIESDGKKFDPNFHEALVHEEDDSKEESKIIQTFQKGYMLGDKVIRHSLVKVLN